MILYITEGDRERERQTDRQTHTHIHTRVSNCIQAWITAVLGVVDWYLTAHLLRDKTTSLHGRSRVLAYGFGKRGGP